MNSSSRFSICHYGYTISKTIDYLGSVTAVLNARDGTVYEKSNYSAYGSRSIESSITPPSGITLRDHYTGCEDLTPDFSIPYADHSARFYSPALHRWMVPDPKSEDYYGISPYVYCGGNPMARVDTNGMWDISVQAYGDRSKSSYALLSVYTRDHALIFKTVVRVQGKTRDRTKKNADTPTGKYKIVGWRTTGNGSNYPVDKYGKYDLLALEYFEGEAAGARDGMHLHGGRNQENGLQPTHGCIRINDEDLRDLKLLVSSLEERDPREGKGIVIVDNSLDFPVNYDERDAYKQTPGTGEITPAIVTAESVEQRETL